jgi:hypothetical protein
MSGGQQKGAMKGAAPFTKIVGAHRKPSLLLSSSCLVFDECF